MTESALETARHRLHQPAIFLDPEAPEDCLGALIKVFEAAVRDDERTLRATDSAVAGSAMVATEIDNEADARRIAACVNALAGVPIERLEEEVVLIMNGRLTLVSRDERDVRALVEAARMRAYCEFAKPRETWCFKCAMDRPCDGDDLRAALAPFEDVR